MKPVAHRKYLKEAQAITITSHSLLSRPSCASETCFSGKRASSALRGSRQGGGSGVVGRGKRRGLASPIAATE